jgi:DNA-binding XRE family transcriptional regulator
MSKEQPAFYTRLRLVRTERAISRRQLADAVGVHYQTIGYIERGDYAPSVELVLRLARFFDLPVEALFSLDPFTPLDARALTGRRADHGTED